MVGEVDVGVKEDMEDVEEPEEVEHLELYSNNDKVMYFM